MTSVGRVRVTDAASARRFVDACVVPGADTWDRAQHLPADLLDAITVAGLWGLHLPADVGGQGSDHLTLGLVHEEVGRGCSSVRSLLTVHTMVSWAVDRWGSAEQRRRWLPAMAAGTALGAFCLTEPNAGSDASGIEATAVQGPQGWVVNGDKQWITGGLLAGVFLVFARTDKGVSALLVPADAPGVEVVPVREVLGTRAAMLAEVRFRDALAGPDALLGPPAFATATVMSAALDLGRYSVACGSVGLMRACLEASARYAAQRRVGGTPLLDKQLVRAKLTDMVTSVRAGRLLCEEAGRLKDARDHATVMATWIAKYYTSTAAARVASDAVQIHGANGCGDQYPVARFFRDAKIAEIVEGSTEVQQTTIADEAFRAAAAHPASPGGA